MDNIITMRDLLIEECSKAVGIPKELLHGNKKYRLLSILELRKAEERFCKTLERDIEKAFLIKSKDKNEIN